MLQGEAERVEENTDPDSLLEHVVSHHLPHHLPHRGGGQSSLAGSVINKSE